MKYKGTVKDGVIVLDDNAPLEEGTIVQVEPVSQPSKLRERLKALSGTAKNLPGDMAENHDHYLHGRPKR